MSQGPCNPNNLRHQSSKLPSQDRLAISHTVGVHACTACPTAGQSQAAAFLPKVSRNYLKMPAADGVRLCFTCVASQMQHLGVPPHSSSLHAVLLHAAANSFLHAFEHHLTARQPAGVQPAARARNYNWFPSHADIHVDKGWCLHDLSARETHAPPCDSDCTEVLRQAMHPGAGDAAVGRASGERLSP